MTIFYVALIVGAFVAVVYLAAVFTGFQRARHDNNNLRLYSTETESPDTYEQQEDGFSWIAGAGVVVSTTLLVVGSVWSGIWYALPFLSIGTAVAVIIAFFIDNSTTKDIEGHA